MESKNNDYRAGAGRTAAVAYSIVSDGPLHGEEMNTIIGDMIGDICHYAESLGYDAADLVRRGLDHWSSERMDPDGQLPFQHATITFGTPSLMPEPKTEDPVIWVATISHKHGHNFYVDTTDDGLTKQMAQYCRDCWDEVSDHDEVPDDHTGIPDQMVIDFYFEHNDQEYIDVHDSAKVPGLKTALKEVYGYLIEEPETSAFYRLFATKELGRKELAEYCREMWSHVSHPQPAPDDDDSVIEDFFEYAGDTGYYLSQEGWYTPE